MVGQFDSQRLHEQDGWKGDGQADAPAFEQRGGEDGGQTLGNDGVNRADQAGHREDQQEALDVAAVALVDHCHKYNTFGYNVALRWKRKHNIGQDEWEAQKRRWGNCP